MGIPPIRSIKSFALGFSTDQPGRAEGWHPKVGRETDPVFIIVDEGFDLDYWIAFAIAVIIVPVFGFALSGRVAFKRME